MTKKDYVNISNTLSVLQERGNPVHVSACGKDHNDIWKAGIRDSARALSIILAADNPRFDRARFLKACGVAQ